MNHRQKKLKQGRDRVDEIYRDTHYIDKMMNGMGAFLGNLPPWGKETLLKDAWKRGDTYYDVPGVYRYNDTRTGETIYYGQSECSIRARTYKFLRHTRFADAGELDRHGRRRCNEQHSKTWVYKLGRTYQELIDHVSVQYIPIPRELAKSVEASLLSKHYTEYNSLPLLNSSF